VGQNVDDVVSNMRRALTLHFEGMPEDGDPIPKSSAVASYRRIIGDWDADQYLRAHVQIDTKQFEFADR
jgi:hypothetical protein